MTVELLAAFIGAIIGATSSHIFQHRLWLRDARREAYLDAMSAMDDLDNAITMYIVGLGALVDLIDDGAPEAVLTFSRDRCMEYLEATRSREVAAKRAESAIELVGSTTTKLTLGFVRHSSQVHAAHWPDSTPSEMRHAIDAMRAGRSAARDQRETLLAHAKADLGIDQTPAKRFNR